MNHLRFTRKYAGVTFIELMIVLSIFALMAGISYPSLKGLYKKNQLNLAAKGIVSLVRYAKSEAVFLEREVEIHFDVNGNAYRYDSKTEKKELVGLRKKRKDEFERAKYLPGGIDFIELSSDVEPVRERKKIARVVFYPDGTASWAIIRLKGIDDKELIIEISPATALPSVKRETKNNTGITE